MMTERLERQRLEGLLRGQQHLLEEVYGVLAEEQRKDDVLRAVVLSSRGEQIVRLRRVDPGRVYALATIRSVCIKYRLRFLDSGLFKGEIPSQAIHSIRELERMAEGPIISYKMMAPADRFRLCDSEVDPLLFVPLGNDRYYLVHKWGRDLSPWRRLHGWPFRSIVHLASSVLLLSVLMALLVPGTWIGVTSDMGLLNGPRCLFLLWEVLVLSSFTVFGWFAFFGQFSTEAWNSRYFN